MSADLVISNARVFNPGQVGDFADSIAITGDRVSGVGSVNALIGPRTEVIDADDALVTPGFIDAHVHPVTSGLDALRCSFDDCSSADSAYEYVARYAADNADAPWVLGAGWLMDWFPAGCPSKELLDRIVPDRPALLGNADGHGAWVNSKALEIAGITGETPDPSDGRIERLADGNPQGTLHEGAVLLVERHTPPDAVEDFEAGLIRGQAELLRYGVTGWNDANVGFRVQEAYLNTAARGELIGRVVGSMWWHRDKDLEQIGRLVERRERSAPNFAPTAVKLMLDGVAENYTASTLEPWLDRDGFPTDNLGTDFIDSVALREIVTALDSAGFQCHFHALGDRAVRSALDAIEAARDANGASALRHHLAHLQFVHPDDVPRFATLEAVANVQPFWACNDKYQTFLTRPYITEERDRWQYPFGSLLKWGARMGMGSDWGVSTPNVMRQIDVAISRRIDDGAPLWPEEALTPHEALTAFTAGSAYINHCEQDSGVLAVGMLADVVVFDRDPFAEGQFRDAEVRMTIVGGEIVFENS